MSNTSRFKSPEAEASYWQAYDTAMQLWPVPFQTCKLLGSYGISHVSMVVSPDLPPLILIHGAQFNSAVWYANIKALSQHFSVYAVDVVDQMGRSIPTRKLQTPDDYSNWLGEIMDSLKLESAIILGHSQGGWQALNMAIKHPERVNRLVLLAPAPAFVQLRFQLLLRMLPIFIIPTKAMFYWSFQGMTTMPLGGYHPLIEQFIIGAKAFKPAELSLGASSVFTDEELMQIKIPALLLIGDCELVYQPQQVLNRARRLMPNLGAELIANGGHLFQMDQAEATNAQILKFLLS